MKEVIILMVPSVMLVEYHTKSMTRREEGNYDASYCKVGVFVPWKTRWRHYKDPYLVINISQLVSYHSRPDVSNTSFSIHLRVFWTSLYQLHNTAE